MRNAMRQGFTLIELLVTLILLGLLTAIVFPVVVQQIADAEPTKMANDLTNIRTGIETFHLNVRPTWPGDLEDLTLAITTSDSTIVEGGYTSLSKWNGPYIDAALASAGVASGDAILTGFGLQIQNELICYDPSANTFSAYVADKTSCAAGQFVSVKVDGDGATTLPMDDGTSIGQGSEFTAIDDLIDNGDGYTAGKIRAAHADGTALDATSTASVIVYLATPFSN